MADGTLTPAASTVPMQRGLQLVLLTAAITAAVYAKAGLGPLQEAMRSSLALSDNEVALLQGPALGLPMLMFAIPLGLFIDRRSRVNLLGLLVVLLLLGSLLTAFAPNFSVLFMARSLVGFAAFAVNPTALSLLADLYVPAQRGRAVMAITIGQFAGASAVFALGGMLLAAPSHGLDGWRWAMLWLSGPLVLAALAMVALREPPRTGRAIERPSAHKSLVELWSYRAVIAPLMIAVITAEVALGSVMIWAAPTLSRTFGLQADRVGAVMGTVILAGGISGTVAGGILADRSQRTGGPRRTLATLAALAWICVPAGLCILMPTVAWASVALFMLIATLTAILVMGTTLFILVIPNELRGLCIGLLTALGAFIGVGLAPLAVSALSGAIGGPDLIGQALALVCVVASLLCATAFALGRRQFPTTAAR
jgi:MFS family permease